MLEDTGESMDWLDKALRADESDASSYNKPLGEEEDDDDDDDGADDGPLFAADEMDLDN